MIAERLARVLPRLGLSDPAPVHGGEYWQLIRATEAGPFEQREAFVLYLDSRVTWAAFEDIAREAYRKVKTASRYHVVVQNSATPAQDLERVKNVARASTASSVRQVLERSLTRLISLPSEDVDDESFALFVDPDVRGNVTGPKALESLGDWFTREQPNGPHLAVLRAPAGVGKTTVARQLFRHLRQKKKRLPLLVRSDQWASFSDRTNLSLWDVWRESLNAIYSTTLSRDDFDVCVENGLFLPIFDGFDELCTRLGSQLSPADVLDELIDLVGNSDGRLLLTTRDAFWDENVAPPRRDQFTEIELLPFNKQQTAKYFENRFKRPADFEKRTTAKTILQRLGGQIASGSGAEDQRSRITSQPLVIALVADCADAEHASAFADKYGGLLDGKDPLEGVLLMLCERERERRKLAVEPGLQLDFLSEMACDYSDAIPLEVLELYADAHARVSEQGQLEALKSHALLQRASDGSYQFRFNFLADYLAARSLLRRLVASGSIDGSALKILEREARGGSPIVDRLVDRFFAHHETDWKPQLQSLWRIVRTRKSLKAQSCLFHLIARAAQREIRSGPKSEVTDLVSGLIGCSSPLLFEDLHLEGPVAGLALDGVSWVRCRFINSGFASCSFDVKSRFSACQFDGGFEVDACQGFGDVLLGEDCTLGLRATEVIQSIQGLQDRAPVDESQIRATVRLALEKFQRGVGFKSLARTNCTKGRLGKSAIATQVWDALERTGVISAIPISGVSEGGLVLADGHTGEVVNYLENMLATGGVRDAIDLLRKALVAR